MCYIGSAQKDRVLIPSVMALRETAMTAPLGQQGEPFAPLHKGSLWGTDCHTSDIGHWFAMTYALPGAFSFECHPLFLKTHTGNAIRHCPYTIRRNPLGGILGGISVLTYARVAPRFRQASRASSSGVSWQMTLSQASFAPSA